MADELQRRTDETQGAGGGRMDRRAFLGASAAAAALAMGRPRAGAAEGKRPNILFILSDDHRWDAMSCMGHPFVQTPQLDRICREGARFANAFVTTSLCSPARASFLTGCYAHTHGVTDNWGREYDPEITPPFPLLLQRAGYETAMVGKWHMADHAEPRAGFDYWLSFRGQGVYFNPTLNENGRTFEAEGYMTDLLTDYALRWLEQPREKPFCMILSHKAVHGDFQPAPRHADLYEGEELPEPPNYHDTFKGKAAWQRKPGGWVRRSGEEVREEIPAPGPWRTPESAMDYFRTLAAVDEGVGRVLDLLEAQGRLDDTLVIYAGDNGMFWGEHRRGDKRVPYEEALRIPLLMRYPRAIAPGSVVEDMVLNIDVAPTICELAGADQLEVMQGRSVTSLFADADARWRDAFLYTYWVDYTPAIPRIIGIRTARHKLLRYPDLDDIDELYDLEADPHELRNIAQDPAHAEVKARLDAALDRLLRETGYRADAGQPLPSEGAPAPEGLILHYALDAADGGSAGAVADSGPFGLDGEVVGGDVERRDGGLHFDGAMYVQAPRHPGLNPSAPSYRVEARVRVESDGVVLAHGGASQGYVLYVQDGAPALAVRKGMGVLVLKGDASCLGRWTRLGAVIDNASVALYVDGREADRMHDRRPILTDPNEGMAIGADPGSVVFEEAGGGFTGLAAEVVVRRSGSAGS